MSISSDPTFNLTPPQTIKRTVKVNNLSNRSHIQKNVVILKSLNGTVGSELGKLESIAKKGIVIPFRINYFPVDKTREFSVTN